MEGLYQQLAVLWLFWNEFYGKELDNIFFFKKNKYCLKVHVYLFFLRATLTKGLFVAFEILIP